MGEWSWVLNLSFSPSEEDRNTFPFIWFSLTTCAFDPKYVILYPNIEVFRS